MAVTATKYDNLADNLWGGTASGGAPIDYLTDTIKVSLHTASYTPNAATHDFYNDVTNELGSGNGYTTGGEALASKTVGSVALGTIDAADVTWTFTASKTFRYAVVYKDTGTASTSPLICYVDFGADITVAVPFTLQWNASGIVDIT
jgi:hypothetical protein